jgi:hypothetical protein
MTASFLEVVNGAGELPTPSPTFEPFTDLDDVPPQAPIDSVKRKGKGLHKRTISAAIPSTEEVVAADGGLRKSAPQRKPTTRS